MEKLNRLFILALTVLAVYSHSKRKDLQDVGTLLPALSNHPIQSESSEEAFWFNYRDRRYYVEPRAEYELWGLVVTHNDIREFSDIYHDEDSVDIKDICVIWGDNARNSDYKAVEFWSEPWTCYTRWEHGEVHDFSMNQLSNNHLLSDYASVRKTIDDMQVGDQIYISGLLVDYSEPAHSSWVRKSSLVRDDEGNGACEVLFAREARILKSGPDFWRNVHYWSKRSLVFWLILTLAHFLYTAYRPMFQNR